MRELNRREGYVQFLARSRSPRAPPLAHLTGDDFRPGVRFVSPTAVDGATKPEHDSRRKGQPASMKLCIHSPGRIDDEGTPSDNLGDVVIERAAIQRIRALGIADDQMSISSLHRPIPAERRQLMRTSHVNVVAGSNAIGWPYIHKRSCWKVRPADLAIPLKFVLMGVGWSAYETRPNLKTRYYLRRLLRTDALHSVRDTYTERVLREIGFSNVVYTGCPSMWSFTPEYCRRLPTQKSQVVVTAVTDYRKDPAHDRAMLDVLKASYREVVAFPQGTGDSKYLRSIGFRGRILNHELSFIEVMRRDYGTFDYVGTRLHGGIFCVQNGIRSLIVMVDNRARGICEDTGLAGVERDPLAIAAAIENPVVQEIDLPWEGISRWSNMLSALSTRN
jgi:hypothetical protein